MRCSAGIYVGAAANYGCLQNKSDAQYAATLTAEYDLYTAENRLASIAAHDPLHCLACHTDVLPHFPCPLIATCFLYIVIEWWVITAIVFSSISYTVWPLPTLSLPESLHCRGPLFAVTTGWTLSNVFLLCFH